MKILKLLNKKILLFFLFLIFLNNSTANEPVDIWNIDKTKVEEAQQGEDTSLESDEVTEENISVYDLNNQDNNDQNQILLEKKLNNEISLYGLYDPDENNLSIEMWSESEGEELKKLFDKIINKNLSKDALDILEIALLTNSSTPKKILIKKISIIFKKIF